MHTLISLRALSFLVPATLATSGVYAAQTPIHAFTGSQSSSMFGSAIDSAGDWDVDGFPDVVIGARDFDITGKTNVGAAFVYSGRTGGLLDKISGNEAGANLGVSVAGLGDVNGDGRADIAVGSRAEANPLLGFPDAGSVRVFSGADGSELYAVFGSQDQSAAGLVCEVGDWDGDSIRDFAIGAPLFDTSGSPTVLQNAGRVTVHSGVDGKVLATFDGDVAQRQFGGSLGGGGDLDGDGFLDLAVGAQFVSPPGNPGIGMLRVYSGRTQALLFEAFGQYDLGHLGQSVDFVSDVNGDGRDELLGGAYDAKAGAGVVTLFDGKTGAVLREHAGFAELDHYGTAVAGVGDVNRDGSGDYAVGAFQQVAGTPGYFQVHSGADGSVLYHRVDGVNGGDQLGAALAALGDVDGDGWLDVGATAMRSDELGNDTGSAYVYDVLVHQPIGDFSSGPDLDMYGTPLSSGGEADLELSHAAPGAIAVLVYSTGYAPLPFEGGIVAPSVVGAQILVKVVNAQGRVLLPAIPGGGGPLALHAQYVIFDGVSAPSGWAFSNHLIASFLP